MIRSVRRFFALGIFLALGACMQRTVTQSESRISFSDGWSSQLGDVDKIKEKFASGFEIKDGVAVASNGRQPSPKTLELKTIENKSYAGASSHSATNKPFAGLKMFDRTPSYPTPEAPEATQDFSRRNAKPHDGDKQFSTSSSPLAGQEFAQSSATAPEMDQNFRNRDEKAAESTAKSTRASATLARDQYGRFARDRSTMSEQQVRDVLHPH